MTKNMKLRIALSLLGLTALPGCATTTWHENLLTNDQLVAANCQQLAIEQQRVADNAQHASEASSGGAVASILLGVLEGVAASKSGVPPDANNSATVNSAALADEHSAQSRQLEARKNMIIMLRSKKRCS
jgi:outer membrane murein-binding lipoprotein Lpp